MLDPSGEPRLKRYTVVATQASCDVCGAMKGEHVMERNEGQAIEWALPLERMLALDALRWAWRRVRENDGAAGGDRVSLRRFALDLEANLLALADEVRSGVYRPGPPHHVTIQDGGKARRLSILPVRDRVLQRAALDLIGPAADDQFLPGSFGYRPNLGVQDAVERLVELRQRGFGWVVDADIRDCFGSLPHDRLRDAVRHLLPGLEPALFALIALWIAGTPPHPGRSPRTCGVPLGSPIAPLLCNLYLHALDKGMEQRRFPLVRYADDFVVACKSAEHAERGLRAVEKVLAGLELAVQPRKTRITSFDEGFTFLGVTFEGTDYRYETDGKTVIVDNLPPAWFHYLPEGEYARDA